MSEWYVYDDEEVVGPFDTEELVDRFDAETLVCPAGSENWEKASEIDALAEYFTSSKPTPPKSEEVDDAEDEPPVPTLEKLRSISKQASNDELIREYQKFWDEYDRQEQRLLRNEMVDRNLWADLTESEAEEEDEQDLPV